MLQICLQKPSKALKVGGLVPRNLPGATLSISLDVALPTFDAW